MAEGWHYFAHRLFGDGTEQLIAPDLPLSSVQITRTLSGVDAFSAEVSVEVARLRGFGLSVFVPWETAIFAELDGAIRAGCIVTDSAVEDAKISLTGVGFVGYLTGLSTNDYRPFINADPFDIARFIWGRAQAAGRGDVGLRLDCDPVDTPVRLGREPVEQWPLVVEGTTIGLQTEGRAIKWQAGKDGTPLYGKATRTWQTPGKGHNVIVRDRKTGKNTRLTKETDKQPANSDVQGVLTTGQEPSVDAGGATLEPYTFAPWQDFDLGDRFATLAADGNFDYTESHAWEGDSVRHTLNLTYPGAGRRRDDLRFVVGENVLDVPTIEDSGEDYTDEIIVLGAGEGRDMIRASWPVAGSTRLHRPKVVTDKNIRTKAAAQKRAAQLAKAYSGEQDMSEIKLLNHPNAPLGSWSLGDTITVQGSGFGWWGDQQMTVRILEFSLSPDDGDMATVKVARADKVSYDSAQ